MLFEPDNEKMECYKNKEKRMFKKAAFLLAIAAIVACRCKCNKKKKNLPLIGEKAPAFNAMTTQGPVNFPQDYAGSWVILFSHPADFTPVCTTEFMMFQAMKKEFEEINTKLIGLSVDSLSSHNAWLRTIEEKVEFNGIRNEKITFPLIDDLSGRIADKYGMIQPKADDTKTVRAVFIIDPAGTIRAILYYPLSNGRNLHEIKRLVIALQATDGFQIATPANWNPGDDIILPPPATEKDIKTRLALQSDDVKCSDWFICFKKLPHEELMTKIVMKKDCF